MHGVLQIMRFNWPRYAAAVAAIGGAVLVMRWLPLPTWVTWLLLAGIAAATWWTAASIVASHYIYDRSGVYTWAWLPDRIARPRRYVNVHAGLDESTEKLSRLFPGARGLTLNVYDPARMPEASIRRAQQGEGERADPLALPLRDGEVDTAFVLMAAHELREASDRRAFFAELRRVVRVGGQVVLVEHLRDWANFLAFGPGFTHFIAASSWRRAARDAGLSIADEASATPFIHLFLLRRSS